MLNDELLEVSIGEQTLWDLKKDIPKYLSIFKF